MYIEATISCECGTVSRFEYQDKGKMETYVCPNCKRTMNKAAYDSLVSTMAEFGDWNTEAEKNASGLHEPKMKAVTLTVADVLIPSGAGE